MGTMATSPTRARVPLPGISSRAWEHPADRGALIALRKLKGFDSVFKAMAGVVSERQVRLILLASAVRVDHRQFARVHLLLADVAATLDVPRLPEVYVSASPFHNAVTIGIDKPVVVIDSGLLDLLDDDELRFALGHEIGHVMSGHAVYRTVLMRLLGMTGVLSAVPGGALGARALTAALMEWSRKAELSADRAGLLAIQDPATAARVHMKLASGGHLDDLDTASFFAQAAEYTETEDVRDSILKLFLVEQLSHPFAVVRAGELRRWAESGEYAALLAGDYPRRDDDAGAGLTDAVKEAAAGYGEAFTRLPTALSGLVDDLGGMLGTAREWVERTFRRPS